MFKNNIRLVCYTEPISLPTAIQRILLVTKFIIKSEHHSGFWKCEQIGKMFLIPLYFPDHILLQLTIN